MRRLPLLSLALVACAEPPFSLHLEDNVVAQIEKTMASAQPSPTAASHTRAYLVTADRRLVAFNMAAGTTSWDVPADVTSRVVVGRGFVAHRQGKDAVVVRDAKNGAERCRLSLDDNERLLGMAADERLYFAVGFIDRNGQRERESYIAAANADGCGTDWRDNVTGSLGAPAVLGGVVAVPYLHQNIVLLDGKTGAELGRVRSKEDDLSFVRAAPEGIFYGSTKGLYALNGKSASGTRKGSDYLEAKLISDQLHTFYYWDSYQSAQVDYTAFDRNRLLWRVVTDGKGARFRDDLALLHSYRFFFGFDPATGAMKWAYNHPRVDLVGSELGKKSVFFASADGDVGALDAATGALAWSKKTGLRVSGVTFDAEGFVPEGGGTPVPLAEALSSIVWDPDQRFISVKAFAVEALARTPGVDVTEGLLRIVLKPGIAPQVAHRAAEELIARKDAGSAAKLRAALAVHFDFLDDKQPRGLDALARTVAAIDDKESAPLLAAHLLAPQTPTNAHREIVRALVILGGKGAIEPLRSYLLMYRAEPQVDPVALAMAGEGMLRVGGPEERRLVTFAAWEPRTVDGAAKLLRRALGDEPTDESKGKKEGAAEGKAKVKPARKLPPGTTTLDPARQTPKARPAEK